MLKLSFERAFEQLSGQTSKVVVTLGMTQEDILGKAIWCREASHGGVESARMTREHGRLAPHAGEKIMLLCKEKRLCAPQEILA